MKWADAGAAVTEWHLSFEELNDQEFAALEALFQAVEGSLTPFTFLDPVDNLLAWSEQQNQPVWQAGPLLTVTGGLADPLGGTSAYQISNPTAAILTLQQLINAPASLDYCLSVYASSGSSPDVWLILGSAMQTQPIGPQWSRLVYAGQLQDTSDSISFGIGLDPGATVNIFGMQVEAQVTASLYKQTFETGGVYPNARFRDDTLSVTAVGPGRYSCELDIVNVEYL